jgi:hypothetical protein
MTTPEEISQKLKCGVDALIMHHTLNKKKKAHTVCIESLKNINGDFWGFLDAYNDGMDALCEVQDFLEPEAMRQQVTYFYSAFGGCWELITLKMRDDFIEEHLKIIATIDEIIKAHKF